MTALHEKWRAHQRYYNPLSEEHECLNQIFTSSSIFRFLTRDPSLPIRAAGSHRLVNLSNSMPSVSSAGFPLKMWHPTSSGTPSSVTEDSVQLYLRLRRVPAAGGRNTGASVPHYSYYYTDKITEFLFSLFLPNCEWFLYVYQSAGSFHDVRAEESLCFLSLRVFFLELFYSLMGHLL